MSDPATLETRLGELKQLLVSREYRPKVVDAAIVKAKVIPRLMALKKTLTKKSDRVVFAITHDPRLPSISNIFRKHHKVMIENSSYLKKVFPTAPMVAYMTTT